jgi:hypothetical protein
MHKRTLLSTVTSYVVERRASRESALSEVEAFGVGMAGRGHPALHQFSWIISRSSILHSPCGCRPVYTRIL